MIVTRLRKTRAPTNPCRSILCTAPELTQAAIQQLLLMGSRNLYVKPLHEIFELHLPLLPRGFSLTHLTLRRRTINALTKAGFVTHPQRLQHETIASLMKIKGFGTDSMLDLVVNLDPYTVDSTNYIKAPRAFTRHISIRRRVFQRAVVREAKALTEIKGVGSVLADDPRLGHILRALDSFSGSLDVALDRLRTKRYVPRNPVKALMRLRELRRLIEEFNLLRLEDELFSLIAIPSYPENVRRGVHRYLGWDGEDEEMLMTAKAKFNTTPAYLREATKQTKALLGEAKAPFAPALKRALTACLEILPHELNDDKVRKVLSHEGISRRPFRVSSLQRIAGLIRSEVSEEWIEYVARTEQSGRRQQALEKMTVEAATRVARRYGVGRFVHLTRELKRTVDSREPAQSILTMASSGRPIKEILYHIRQLQPLDADGEWFAVDSVGRQRLVQVIKKVLIVAERIKIKELHASLKRYSRYAKHLPPPQILLSFCRTLEWCTVEDDTISAHIAQEAARVLNPTELIMVEVLRMHGGMMSRADLVEECRSRGVAFERVNFAITVSHVVKHRAKGIYSLCGTAN